MQTLLISAYRSISSSKNKHFVHYRAQGLWTECPSPGAHLALKRAGVWSFINKKSFEKICSGQGLQVPLTEDRCMVV
jgi:hypothetical protein